MSYEHLQNTLKAIALTVPAARAFQMTVEFALGQGKDTATVGRLEGHFRDRPRRGDRLRHHAAAQDPRSASQHHRIFLIAPGKLGVIAITALQYGYPAFMTIDLGAIALSMMRV